LWWNPISSFIDILKTFFQAERTADWLLHLNSLCKMLYLFAATGHNNYAKSACLFLQFMADFPNTHLWLHQQFITSEFRSIMRSDRFWAKIFTDTIEQVLMRAIKSRGGLMHGRGMTESVWKPISRG